MYTIVWFDGWKQHSACAGDSVSAWCIYYALKEQYANHHPLDDIWLYITFNGQCVDPERGGQLPPCDEFKRIILAKATVWEEAA